MSSRIYNIREDYFSNIDEETKAYILGYLFADGHVDKGGYMVVLDLSSTDECIIDLLLKQLYIGKPSKKYYRKILDKTYVKCCLSSRKICLTLLAMGFPEKQTIPLIKKDLFCHFVRGVFDGDGCLTFFKKRPFIFIAGEKLFLEQLQQELIDRLGITKTKLIAQQGVWRLAMTKIKDCYFFFNFLYEDANFFLQRKREKFDSIFRDYDIKKHLEKKKASKYIGVARDRNRNKWMATMGHRLLGRFETEEEAHIVRLKAEKEMKLFSV